MLRVDITGAPAKISLVTGAMPERIVSSQRDLPQLGT